MDERDRSYGATTIALRSAHKLASELQFGRRSRCRIEIVRDEGPQANQQAQTQDNRAEREDRLPVYHSPAQLNIAPPRAILTRIADSLIDEHQIGTFRDYARLHRRYAHLRKQELYDRLVEIYDNQFRIHQRVFKHVLDAFEPPAGLNNRFLAAARAYISCWFWDLYVTNRRSLERISGTALQRTHSQYAAFVHERYDPFLQHLNTVIRPTPIPQALEDSIWIPVIINNPEMEAANPFQINDWYLNKDQVQGLLEVMDQRSNVWRTVQLTHDPTGRPMWLFDWKDEQAYAWFPMEAHFTMEDVIAAYILGVPCTSRLGPRDIDDWQQFPNNVVPANINVNSLNRSTPRNFYGSAEYRTIERRTLLGSPRTLPTTSEASGSKRPRLEEGAQPVQVKTGSGVHGTQVAKQPERARFYQFKIIDWTCHSRIIGELNKQKQARAIRMFLFTE